MPEIKHIEEMIKTKLYKQPYWKTALWGVVCLERQWEVYKKLAFGREWNAVDELQKVINRIWQTVSSGRVIAEDYLYMVEANFPDITEDWDSIAQQCVESIAVTMQLFNEKDKQNALQFSRMNFDFLYYYCDLEGDKEKILNQQEIEAQQRWLSKIIEFSDKKEGIQWCKNHCGDSILGECWFSDYPAYQMLPKKKDTMKREQKEIADYFSLYSKASEIEPVTKYYAKCYMIRKKCYQPETKRREPERWIDIINQGGNYIHAYVCLAGIYESIAINAYLYEHDIQTFKQNLYLSAKAVEMYHLIYNKGGFDNGFNKSHVGMHKIHWAMNAVIAGDILLAKSLSNLLYLTEQKKEVKPGEFSYTYPFHYIQKFLIEGNNGKLNRIINDWKAGKNNPFWPKMRRDGKPALHNGSTEYFDFYEGFAECDNRKILKAFVAMIKSMRKEVRGDYLTLLDLHGIACARIAVLKDLPLPLNIAEIPAELYEDTSGLTVKPILPGAEKMKHLFQLD